MSNIIQALEAYIQDAFANTISETNSRKRSKRLSEVFSYLGNQNNPPDSILNGGDAIEVKKIQSKGSAIAFSLACIVREDKFNSFNSSDRESLSDHSDIVINDIEIRDPNNPAKLLKAKLITLEVS